MNHSHFQRFLPMAVLSLFSMCTLAAGDAGRGAQLFRQCAACHSIAPGEHLTGPSLAHVVGHKAASAEGFQRYSDALKRSGVTWTDTTLDRWLADPNQLVPGNSMTFPGVRDQQARQDLIAYLKAAGEMRMGRQPPRLDLKAAPPEGQVSAIRYCGDTY